MRWLGITREDIEAARDSFDKESGQLHGELSHAAHKALTQAMQRSPGYAALWLGYTVVRDIWYDVKDARWQRRLREKKRAEAE
jgi:hypothetical protein